MRKLVASAFVSLDRVMRAPGGPEEDRSGGFEHGGWLVPLLEERPHRGYERAGRVATGSFASDVAP
jgi:hypothetical protein